MSLDKFKIQKTAQRLVGHLDPEAKLELIVDDNGVGLNIDTEVSGLLIGRHGETLEALEHVLRLMLAKEFEEFIPIRLDIAGYRSARLSELEEMTKNAAQKVLNFGGTVALPPMSSYERRLVHVALQSIGGVEGVSEGEEPYRRIVIKPK